jgi:hypothetical protein
VRVGLVQINMGGRRPPKAGAAPVMSVSLLPYSTGLLKSYAIAHAAQPHEWLLPIYRRVGVAEGADALEDADVVAFSIYVWNARLSLAIAAEVKRRRPQTLIVFGGPQVPGRPAAAEAFLREHHYVDIACNGEGEAVFTAILDRAHPRDFAEVPGVSYLDADGRLEIHANAPRLRDLEQIPSPYTSGAFDDLLAARPDHRWVMIWETNRGCPFSCAFCDWGSATASKVFRFDIERLAAEIEWMAERRVPFVWCADANFGALRRDLDLAERVVASYERTGFPASLTVQSTKNATERAYRIQKLLQTHMSAFGVTLALQSVNDKTLANINRANISSESYRELQRRFAAEGVYTYTDLILGLPGETYTEFTEGVSRVIADGQHNHIQLYSCSVLPNAEMGDPAYQERFGMQIVPQAIRSVHDLIEDDAGEVEEYLDLVVATTALPAVDWRRARVFAWMVDLAYFDRVLQIPLLVLHKRHGWPVHEMIEALLNADQPIVSRLVGVLDQKATSIQQGGPEYFPVPAAGGLLWPGDQRSLIALVLEDQIEAFYAEAGDILAKLLEADGHADDVALLDEMLALNRAALTLPFTATDQLLALSHNVWEHYQSLLIDRPQPLEEGLFIHRIDGSRQRWDTLDDWAQHLAHVQGKDKRAYLRTVTTPRRAGRPAAVPAA